MQDLRRQTCVITGATSEIGFETARQLAALGVTVIGIGRQADKCRQAQEAIIAACPDAKAEFIVSDLSSLGNVRNAATTIKSLLPKGRLERLIHNAAILSRWYIGTEDGCELQFAVNYLAAFLLTRELFPCLVRPDESRVIVLCSGSHRRTRINWKDPMFKKKYNSFKAYKQSKLALVLFTLELNRRAAGRFPLRAIGIELGLADFDLGEMNTSGWIWAFWRRLRKKNISPAEAAAAVVRLASDPSSKIPADYWRRDRPAEPSPYARRVDAALQLWQLSERLCGTDFL